MKPVLVFKTSVTSRAQVHQLKPNLDKLIQQNDRWNFDLEDCDHILRVESAHCHEDNVIETLKVAGYACETLQ